MSSSVVVVGAGVIGLTTAITLLENIQDIKCTIVAEHLPGDDKTIGYASPWAGAHHVSHAKKHDTEMIELDRIGLRVLMKEYEEKATTALMLIDQSEYYMEGADNGSNMEGLQAVGMPGMRQLRPEELPPNCLSGLTFKTLTIDTSAYLEYLAHRFRDAGGQFVRATISSLKKAPAAAGLAHTPALLVNCTGLGSLKLADVQDQGMFPVRGQLCLVRAPWMTYGKTYVGRGQTSYSIPRSSGIVVLGGTRDANDWCADVRPETSETIRRRAVEFDRNLLPPEKRKAGTYLDLDVIEEGCGLRPGRQGGARLKVDMKCVPGLPVLHNYGHAGFGWQTAWGYAEKAFDLCKLLLLDPHAKL